MAYYPPVSPYAAGLGCKCPRCGQGATMSGFSIILRLLPVVLAALLSGCLISKEPLLNARNGAATPLTPGLYESCQFNGDASEPDCQAIQIKLNDEALYTFQVEDEDERSFVRFRRIARDGWLMQISGDKDDEYSYFLGETAGDDFVLIWILCDVIPEDVREKYSKRGEMEVDKGKYGSTCIAKTLRAAIAGAKAFRAAIPPVPSSRTVLRKHSGSEE
jgi:hypothetical protein